MNSLTERSRPWASFLVVVAAVLAIATNVRATALTIAESMEGNLAIDSGDSVGAGFNAPSRGESGGDATQGLARSITIWAGGSAPTLNELVIVSIGVLDPPSGLTITPPSTTINPWYTIDTKAAGTDYVQYIYWHAIGSDETGLAPSFKFMFDSAVRATGVATLYLNTCTQTTPTPCFSNSGVPYLSPVATRAAIRSNSVKKYSALNIQANGIAFCAFGSNNTHGIGPVNGGTITPSGLKFNNGNSGGNAGLIEYDQFGLPANTAGPWTVKLPGSDRGDNVAQCVSVIPVGF